jgi:predicted Fe-Mo cluster-binding NifX family protein
MNNLVEVIQTVLRRSLEVYKADGSKVFDVAISHLDGHLKAAVEFTNGKTETFAIIDDEEYSEARRTELESSLFGAASLAIGVSNSLRQQGVAAR